MNSNLVLMKEQSMATRNTLQKLLSSVLFPLPPVKDVAVMPVLDLEYVVPVIVHQLD